jgi:hypothetical protein
VGHRIDRGRIDLELAVSLSATVGLPVDVRRLNDAPVSSLFHALRGRVVSGATRPFWRT